MKKGKRGTRLIHICECGEMMISYEAKNRHRDMGHKIVEKREMTKEMKVKLTSGRLGKDMSVVKDDDDDDL